MGHHSKEPPQPGLDPVGTVIAWCSVLFLLVGSGALGWAAL